MVNATLGVPLLAIPLLSATAGGLRAALPPVPGLRSLKFIPESARPGPLFLRHDRQRRMRAPPPDVHVRAGPAGPALLPSRDHKRAGRANDLFARLRPGTVHTTRTSGG